jgi:hypothetical protein
MAYGLRFHTIARNIGSSMSWYVPQADMPDEKNSRGTQLFEDRIETSSGNTFIYHKGKRKVWTMSFSSVSSDSMRKLEHVCGGWGSLSQITVICFGTSVIGTNESMGSMSLAGQVWGTGFARMEAEPTEDQFDMWSASVKFTEFGQDQSFT